MRFGVQLPTFGPAASPGAVLRIAQLAEDLGYDGAWVNDHVMVPERLRTPYGCVHECLVTLSAVAVATARIRIGTSILVLGQRHAVLTAKQLATLDVYSGGRLTVGVAAGYVREEFEQLGAPYENRGRRLEEHVEVLRALWRGESTFSGRWTSFRDAAFGPLPAQGDRVPIWLGGGSARAIERAARLADVWHPGSLSPSALADGAERLREARGARRVGIALKLRVGVAPVGRAIAQHSPAEFGDVHDVVGTTTAIQEELGRYGEAGVDEFVLVFYHQNVDQLAWSMERFAADVIS